MLGRARARVAAALSWPVEPSPGFDVTGPPARVPGRPLGSGGPGNAAAAVSVDYRTPAAIAEATVRSVDAMFDAGMAGRLGQIRWGEKASTYEGANYAGDLGPLQRYAGGQGVPRVATQDTIRHTAGMESGLPATSSVPGQPANQMLALLIATDPYTSRNLDGSAVQGG